MFPERSAKPNNVASPSSLHISTSTATPRSPVHISPFPSATSSLTTSPPTSSKSTKPPTTAPDPRAARVVSLLNALGPSLGPVSQRSQGQLSPPHNSSARVPHAQSVVGVSPPMAGPTTKSNFLDRFSGSPSLGSGPSSDPQSEKKAVRMVGRGGSGSKPRSVNTALKSPPDPRIKRAKSDLSGVSSVPSSRDGKVRYVGRGGQGSKQSLRIKDEGEGGIQKDEVPGVALRLPWAKVKKGQLKITPDLENPMNASEPNHRPIPRQKSQASDASRDTFTSSNAPPSSPNSPNFGDSSVSSLGSIGDKLHNPPGKPKSILHPGEYNGKSINKLAQKMGDLPPHLIHQQLLNQHGHRNDVFPRLDAQNRTHRPTRSTALSSVPLSEKSTSTVTQHRVVNILSSLGPTTTLPRLRSESLTSSQETTRSCELHRFGLADDMSENWGEMKDEDHDCYAENVGWEDVFEAPSPIAFSPPTPVDRKRAAARCSVCHIETGMEPLGDGDSVSEFSVAPSVAYPGEARAIGSLGEEDDGGIAYAKKSHPAETSNGNAPGASCHHGTHLHDMTVDSSSPPSQHHVHCSSDGANPEVDEDDNDTPLVERPRGAAPCGNLAERQLEDESHTWNTSSSPLRSPSWMPTSTSSSFKVPPPPLPIELPSTLPGHSIQAESRFNTHSSPSSPSASTFAIATTPPPRSPPYSVTYSFKEPSRVPPNTPFSTLTPLQLPASGFTKHLKRGGSISSSRSLRSVAYSTASKDSFERSLLAQERRSSQITDDSEENGALLFSSRPSNWRSVEWNEESHVIDGSSASRSPAADGGRDTGKGKDRGPQLWTGEWNTDIDDVIRTLRML